MNEIFFKLNYTIRYTIIEENEGNEIKSSNESRQKSLDKIIIILWIRKTIMFKKNIQLDFI